MTEDSEGLLEGFREWAKGKYSPKTVDIYYRYVLRLSDFCKDKNLQIDTLMQDDIAAFAAEVQHFKPATQDSVRHSLESFYAFLISTERSRNNPVRPHHFVTRSRTKIDRRRPRPSQVSQKILQLSPRDRSLALVVSELLERGATLDEIFSIHTDPPVGHWVEVENGKGERRQFPLSEYAQARLNDWLGHTPINLRGFQRVTAKVDLRPQDLGDPLRPGLGNIHLTLLPDSTVHPSLEKRARPAFLRGEYDTAVFQAMKAVEIAVRRAGDFSPRDIGIPLMRKAFDLKLGPLRDPAIIEAERQATSDLFAGAIGLFKNPSSHRDIDLENPIEVSGILRLADVLLHIVDRAASTSSEKDTAL